MHPHGWIALLALCAAAHAQNPSLKLPPPKVDPAAAAREAAAPKQDDLTRFRADLLNLQGPAPKVEQLLTELGQRYPEPKLENLVVEVARKAQVRELQFLMLVARRFGTPKVADELLFQALARPLGAAARDVLDTMAKLKGEGARAALVECIRSRIPVTRRTATELLAARATLEDLTLALELAGEQSPDLRLCGIDLLAAIPADDARRKLIALLSRDPTVAGPACTALVRQGEGAAQMLREFLQQPAIDRSWAYSAFALSRIEAETGRQFVDAAAVPELEKGLAGPDRVARCLCAIVLADLNYRGMGSPVPTDAAVVEALLDVVAPVEFLPNIDIMRSLAQARLRLLAGRTVIDPRGWWSATKNDFLAMRARVAVTEANAAAARIVLTAEKTELRFLGESLAGMQPSSTGSEVVLTAAQMLALVDRLRTAGFMGEAPVVGSAVLPVLRLLVLEVQGTRAQAVATAADAPGFDRLVDVLDAELREQAWQLYRDPSTDRAAFWRAEREWLAANPDPVEQERRLLRRALELWPALDEVARMRVLERTASRADRGAVLGEETGRRMIALVDASPQLGAMESLLLEFAAMTPGDTVWREAVARAWQKTGGGRDAVTRLFKLLGRDRVLAALSDTTEAVRLAAIDEIVSLRDPRNGPELVKLLADADPDVQRSAVFAVGMLGVADAAPILVKWVADPATDPVLRREALHSIGRIGWPTAFDTLRQAIGSPVVEDRLAAIRGLGELKDARAANLLTDLFVSAPASETGELARFHLQRMGARWAVPALRAQLRMDGLAARAEVVLLLGSYQDPEVVPELIDLLRSAKDPLPIVAMIEATTGAEFASRNDRLLVLEQWWRAHREESQWRWLLRGLDEAKVKHALTDDMYTPGAGLRSVPELARLLRSAPAPRHRILAAAVLRAVSGEDYGAVTSMTPQEALDAIAARYVALHDANKTGSR
ncbi:MAG: hypothetical protein RL148_409 [Planctomycetota bacterium]